MTFLILFVQFFKTGLFAVGGGLATIPFLYAMVDKFGWFTGEMLANMIAVAESTPGPIGVNVATYAGYTTQGIWGALCATVGLVLPSYLVILIISGFLKRFGENFYVKSAFYAIRPASTALIATAAVNVIYSAILPQKSVDFAALVLAAACFVTAFFCKKIHPAFIILFAGAVGIIKGILLG